MVNFQARHPASRAAAIRNPYDPWVVSGSCGIRPNPALSDGSDAKELAMSNLIAVMAMAAASIAYYWWFLTPGKRQATPERTSSAARLAAAPNVLRGSGFVALYSLTLLLALRFGARVDPGTWVPGSEVLNAVFNGGLIWLVGYIAVAFAACMSTARLVAHEAGGIRGHQIVVITRTLSRLAIGLATLLSLYGLYCAVVFQRLPA
jgi:hypothetical protein